MKLRSKNAASLPIHYSIVVFDIQGFSAPYRDDRAQLAVRSAFYYVVREAFATAQVSWDSCIREDRGDGAIVIVPATVSKVWLLDPLPSAILAAVQDHNRTAKLAARIRMRVAIHAGDIIQDDYGMSGSALVEACRLLDSRQLRAALANADVPLALIVSDTIYESIVRHQYGRIEATTYHPVSVQEKQHRLHGWIHLPGITTPPSFS